MKRILTLSLIVLAATVSLLDAAPPQYTLEECIALGLARSIPLANARRDLETARWQIHEVRAQALPALNLDASYTRIDDVPTFPDNPGMPDIGLGAIGSRSQMAASVTAEQLLYAGGAVRTALDIARDYKAAAEHELDRATSDLMRRITRGFYEVLFREASLQVARDSLTQRAEFETQVRRRYAAETASEFEWLSAQVALANERPAVIAAENALVLAKRAFRDLIRIDEETFSLDGKLEDEVTLPELTSLQARALDQRPELRRTQAEYRVAVQQRRVTLSSYLPELTAFATYGGADPSQRDFFSEGWQWEWMAGVRASWSLFDGGRRRAAIKQDMLAIDRMRDTIDELERETLLEIEQLWWTLQEIVETLKGTSETVQLAERALEIVRTRYAQGLATNLDFTDSHLALHQARLNHQHAWLGWHQAWADLRHVAALHVPPEKDDIP